MPVFVYLGSSTNRVGRTYSCTKPAFQGALERHVANCSRADPVPARMKVVGVSVFFDLLRLHDS
jgi:hypothetical protein